MSVISRVGWVEQVRRRGLRQLDLRVEHPQWPPFRGELDDLEADSSFSPTWWPPQQADPSHRSYKNPPRGAGICEPWDDVGLSNCPNGPSRQTMSMQSTERKCILCRFCGQIFYTRREWQSIRESDAQNSHTLGWLSLHPWSTRDPEWIEACGQPYGVT